MWGSQHQQHEIFIEESTYRISGNLHVALCYLRQPAKPRTLWVDGICINQADDAEKTHQVSRILDIYREASRVLTWLGESARDTSETMSLIQSHHGAYDLFDHHRPGLQKLIAFPWWSCIWVVQEVVVARWDPLVMFGEESAR